jgi:hypothetical protein
MGDHPEDYEMDYTDCHGTEWKQAPCHGELCHWCADHVEGAALVDAENERYLHFDCWDSHDGFSRAMDKDD